MGGGAQARDHFVSPEQAPRAWVAYAEGATTTVTGWLNGDAQPAPRLRNAIEAARPAPDQPVPPLVVQLWIERDGTLSRIEPAAPSAPQLTQDLRTLLVGRRLPPPPKKMRLPLRLALQVQQPSPPGNTI
jgi:hypothetical protein